jgi:hypothetical protein
VDDRRARELEALLPGASCLYEFEIAHVGWECDSNGWVCEHKGKRKLVLTDHGSMYVEADPTVELRVLIAQYESLIASAKRAQNLLCGED